MKKTAILFAGLVAALTSCFIAGSASALEPQTWVSSTGSGTACTRAAPCASFAVAQANTFDEGVISVLDSGNYNVTTITITKSLIIRAEGVDGGHTSVNTGGTFITVAAGPSDVVTLEGLHLNGGGGVNFTSGGQLNIVRCVITNGKTAAGGSGHAGIRFRPSGASKLSVTDTVILNMGTSNGGGIVINPQAGGSVQAALERVTLNGNAFGLAVDGTGSTAGINVTIADSMIANNTQAGILAITPGGGAPIGVMVADTKSVNNNVGLWSVGPNVTIRASGSRVIGNGTGLQATNGGALLTFGTNEVVTNGSNGAFTGSVARQ